ncbi:MAG: aminotransferase, partial [Flavobacteriales bacterium CG_4_9_14_0_2_um_filter_35_242]
IEQILEWKTQNIQDYCQQIAAKAVNELQSLGCFIEDEAFRAKHLFGIYLPDTIDIENLKASFNKHKIFVSFRGKAIRVSPNIYNTKADFDNLLTCFKEVIS